MPQNTFDEHRKDMEGSTFKVGGMDLPFANITDEQRNELVRIISPAYHSSAAGWEDITATTPSAEQTRIRKDRSRIGNEPLVAYASSDQISSLAIPGLGISSTVRDARNLVANSLIPELMQSSQTALSIKDTTQDAYARLLDQVDGYNSIMYPSGNPSTALRNSAQAGGRSLMRQEGQQTFGGISLGAGSGEEATASWLEAHYPGKFSTNIPDPIEIAARPPIYDRRAEFMPTYGPQPAEYPLEDTRWWKDFAHNVGDNTIPTSLYSKDRYAVDEQGNFIATRRPPMMPTTIGQQTVNVPRSDFRQVTLDQAGATELMSKIDQQTGWDQRNFFDKSLKQDVFPKGALPILKRLERNLRPGGALLPDLNYNDNAMLDLADKIGDSTDIKAVSLPHAETVAIFSKGDGFIDMSSLGRSKLINAGSDEAEDHNAFLARQRAALRGGYTPQDDRLDLEDQSDKTLAAMQGQRASLPRTARAVPIPAVNPNGEELLTWDQLQARRSGGLSANQSTVLGSMRAAVANGKTISGASGLPDEQRKQLRDIGYSPDDVDHMTPDDVQAVLSGTNVGAGNGGQIPPEQPPVDLAEPGEPQPARKGTPGPSRMYSTTPPASVSKRGEWFTGLAGLGHVPTADEADVALNLLAEKAPAYQTMFMGQTAMEDPSFNAYMTTKGRSVQQAHETVMAEHWTMADNNPGSHGKGSRYYDAAGAGGSSAERLVRSKELAKGQITLNSFNANYGTKGLDPVAYDEATFAQRNANLAQGAALRAERAQTGVSDVGNTPTTQPDEIDRAFPPRSEGSATDTGNSVIDPARTAANVAAWRNVSAASALDPTNPFARHAAGLASGDIASNRDYLPFSDPTAAINFSERLNGILGGNNNVNQTTHGPLGQIVPQLDAEGNRTGAMQFEKDGQVTAGPEIFARGKLTAGAAANNALSQGGFTGLNDDNAIATFRKRVNSYLYEQGEKFSKELGNDPEMKGRAGEISKQIVEAARTLLSPVMMAAEEANGGTGVAGGLSMNALKLKGTDNVQRAMNRNPTFNAQVEQAGGIDAVSNGPSRIFEAEGKSYETGGKLGENKRFGGQDGGDFISSIYRTPMGKFQMSSYMAKMWWEQSAGQVMGEATAYGTEAARFAGMSDYGGGERSTAEMSAAHTSVGQYARNKNAYDQYGWINEASYALSGGPAGNFLNRAGNDLSVGMGAGGAAGFATYGLAALAGNAAIGAAAGPVGMGVGLGVGLTALAGDVYNSALGYTSEEGMSAKNILRGMLVSSGVPQERSQVGVQGNFFATRVSQDQYMAQRGVTSKAEQADAINSGSILGMNVGKAFDGRLGRWLATDPEQSKFMDQASGISDRLGIPMDQLADPMSMTQRMGGSTMMSEFLIGDAQRRNVSVGQLYSEANNSAVAMGLYEGTEDYNSFVNKFSRQYEKDAPGRAQQMAKDNYRVQLASQMTGYMGGATAQQAMGVMDAMGLKTQTQVGNANAIAASMERGGLAMNNPRVYEGAIQPFMNMSLPQQSAVASAIGRYADVGGSSAKMSQYMQNSANPILANEAMSGNVYAMSDMARSGNAPEWMQMVDARGLKMGESTFSGEMAYLRTGMSSFGSFSPGMSSDSMLSSMGVSDAGYRGALLSGGSRAVEDLHDQRSFNNSMASIGLQFQGIQAQQTFNWGSGSWDAPAAGSMWAMQDQQRAQQWQSQQTSFAFSQRKLDLQQGYNTENDAADLASRAESRSFGSWSRGFDHDTSLLNRNNTRASQQYAVQTNAQNFGWSMEDLDENIRRSSGRDRSLLIRQRDRANVSENMQVSEQDREKKAQEVLWQREDARYTKNEQHIKAMEKLEDDGFLRSKHQRDEMFALDQEQLKVNEKEAKAAHNLQEEMNTAQRKFQAEEIERQKQALGIQAQSLIDQKAYQDAQKAAKRTDEDMAATWAKMNGYSGGIKQMVDSLMQLSTLRMTVSHSSDGSVTISGTRGYVSTQGKKGR